MATSGPVGGSSIDVNSLVSQLVAAERKPLDDQINRAAAKVTTQISAVGSLMGAMSTFRSALASLRTVDAFNLRSTTSSDPKIVNGSATKAAQPGRYDIEVERLATAHQISSDPFSEGATHVVGTGALTITVGSKSFQVQIGDDSSTLAGIRDAINAASDNPGVRATLINASDGAHLVLTSSTTGAANAIQVSQAGGDGGLAALTYSASDQTNYRELKPAQDARVFVAGYPTTSSTNVIEGVIDGVSLNLASAAPGTTVTFEVTLDKAAVEAKIKTFVDAYNGLRNQISRLGGYDAASKTAGPMLGDALLTGVDSELRRTLSEPVSEAGEVYQTLASIGVTTQANGTLAINASKLQTALGSNFEAVSKLFGSEEGVAARLYDQLGARLDDGGALDVRSENLVKEQKTLQKRLEDVNVRMQIVQQAYMKQFTRLDTLLSSLQSTSAFLSQQIESLANLNKSS
jgi:flagellar hook-associated protein 2